MKFISKKTFMECFRFWQIIFATYLCILGLANVAEAQAGWYIDAFINSLVFAPIFYAILRARNSIIMWAKFMEAKINGTLNINMEKIVDEKIEKLKSEDEKK
jgi:hypothetical protein